MARRNRWQTWKRVRPIPAWIWVVAGLCWILYGLSRIF